jgi:hypothetical protein
MSDLYYFLNEYAAPKLEKVIIFTVILLTL